MEMKSDPKAILKSAGVTNVPIAREYIRSKEVQELAAQRYHTTGNGITFNDWVKVKPNQTASSEKTKGLQEKRSSFYHTRT
jgi:hypothetical protein